MKTTFRIKVWHQPDLSKKPDVSLEQDIDAPATDFLLKFVAQRFGEQYPHASGISVTTGDMSILLERNFGPI